MKKKVANYKPLLFSTTMRNPERIKDFLKILYEFKEKILTNSVIEKVVMRLIETGNYETMFLKQKRKDLIEKRDTEGLNEEEILFIIKNSPQKHKEAGFDKGWPSRFDTWYKLAKEFGFVYYWIGDPIKFSESGELLIKSLGDENNEPSFKLEQEVFLNTFVKYQRNNPFRRISNANKPLILLLKLLKKLKEVSEKGLLKQMLPILLCWKDGNVETLFEKILILKNKYGYEISNESILEICDNLTGGKRHASMPDKTIIQEYPDDFIRKMRLTGLITLRGNGRFIDINMNEIEKVNYAINKYSKLENFKDEYDYYRYISVLDKELITERKEVNIDTTNYLKKWRDFYNFEVIEKELLNLENKKSSDDAILKYISNPLRLEFLTALAVSFKYENVIVKPNYIVDDEGLPVSFAGGNKPDIECVENKNGVLLEVTLLTGVQQHIRESFSIQRHLEEYKKQNINTITFFIAPLIHIDTKRNADYNKREYGLKVFTYSISEFLNQIKKEQNLYINN